MLIKFLIFGLGDIFFVGGGGAVPILFLWTQ